MRLTIVLIALLALTTACAAPRAQQDDFAANLEQVKAAQPAASSIDCTEGKEP